MNKVIYKNQLCFKMFLFLLVVFGGVTTSRAQTTLVAGDIALIEFDATTDAVRFVTLANMAASTVITITDKGWQDASIFTTATTEGTITWTLGSAVPAGTVFELVLGGSDNSPATRLTNITTGSDLTANIVSNGYITAADAITTTGDSFTFYQGISTNPFFISGFNNSAGVVDAAGWNTVCGPATAINSRLPGFSGSGSQNSLISGVTAIGMPANVDRIAYTGPTSSANKATWQSRFFTLSNFSSNDVTLPPRSITTSISITGLLPVQLLSFTTTKQQHNILLKWETADAVNFDHFELERSNDGQNFSIVASIKATIGNSKASYQYLDADMTTMSGPIYYRLKMLDIDGQYSYSKTMMVKENKHVATIVAGVLPNPFTNEINIRFNLENDQTVSVRLVDLSGREVRNINELMKKGISTRTVNGLASLENGVYFLKVQSGTETITQKIIKR